jgi:hypothetical protein
MHSIKLLASVSALVLATSATASESLAVLHPATQPPSYIDVEPKGVDSPGDMRIFHFSGVTRDGQDVVMDWTMTTTAQGTVEGANSRVTLGVFSFGANLEDQVLIQGVGRYPNEDSTFKTSSTLSRSIIGGTGAYAGARGVVVSTHLEDGSWVHEFHFAE